MEQPIPVIERPAFFEGQRLTAADLAAVQAYARELRWLHNRALHGWGIALGLGIAGARGDRSVSVAPGYALDCLGRDLVLESGRALAVPPAASGSFALTISYAADDELDEERRRGVCGADGAVRLVDEPLLRWLDATGKGEERVRLGLDVVLAVVDVTGCAIERLTTGERQDLARSTAHAATGRTPPEATSWRLWPDADNPVGVATTVETISAGFSSTPAYQARLGGERVIDGNLIDGYEKVDEAGPQSFDFVIVLAINPADYFSAGGIPVNSVSLDDQTVGRLRDELGWHVVWIGVEG